MYWLSTIYFFVVTLLSGTLIDLFVKNWEADWLEKFIMRFGVGLAALSVIGVILNLFHIPLDYRVFLGIGLFVFIGAFVRNNRFRSFETYKISHAQAQFWKKKSFWYAIFILVLFGVTLKMYVGGTFKYSYLEDTDPWGYTADAGYIGQHKTFSVPYYSIQYNEPYTQGYQIVMGVLSQTNDSLYWTMKFFSALIISFGVLFIYYFARQFSKNEEVAVLTGFILFAVPAWVSHFVFSLNYNMTIFIVLLYVLAQLMYKPQKIAPPPEKGTKRTNNPSQWKLLKQKDEENTWLENCHDRSNRIKGWTYVGMVVYASMLINHFSTAIHGSLFCLVLIITRTLAEKKIDWKTIKVFQGGFFLSLLFYIPAYAKHWGLTKTEQFLGGMHKLFPLMHFVSSPFGIVTTVILLTVVVFVYRGRTYWQQPIEKWLDNRNRGMTIWLSGLTLVLIVLFLPIKISHTLGTGDRYYVMSDFFLASTTRNMINNPVGLGFVLMSTIVASFLLASAQIKKLFKPSGSWKAVSYAWIITAFLLVLGKYFSIAISPFRIWPFLGLFASLFAAWGMTTIIQSFSQNYWILLVGMVLFATATIPTSFIPKLWLNTTLIWKDAMIGTPESRKLFAWMRKGGIPKNSVVAHLCGNSEFLSGYDMAPPLWDETFHPEHGKQPYFVVHPLKITPEAYSVLKKAHVEYVSMGASCLWQMHVPPSQQESYGKLIGETMNELEADKRLTLVRETEYELLFKLR